MGFDSWTARNSLIILFPGSSGYPVPLFDPYCILSQSSRADPEKTGRSALKTGDRYAKKG
jgi:hypothetical protein